MQKVTVKETGKEAIVTNIHPHPFMPSWLVSPNYSILECGCSDVNIVRQNMIRKCN